MINILLVCNAGMSTSLLVTKMQDVAKVEGIEAEIWAVSSSESNENFEKADICLVGPQIRFMVKKFQALTDTPVMAIEMTSYGRMDGKAVLDAAMKALGK